MSYADIAKIIPTIQAAQLAGDNISFAKSKDKSFAKQSVKNIVGVSLIGATAKLTNAL